MHSERHGLERYTCTIKKKYAVRDATRTVCKIGRLISRAAFDFCFNLHQDSETCELIHVGYKYKMIVQSQLKGDIQRAIDERG
jgi:hypothetical protein